MKRRVPEDQCVCVFKVLVLRPLEEGKKCHMKRRVPEDQCVCVFLVLLNNFHVNDTLVESNLPVIEQWFVEVWKTGNKSLSIPHQIYVQDIDEIPIHMVEEFIITKHFGSRSS